MECEPFGCSYHNRPTQIYKNISTQHVGSGSIVAPLVKPSSITFLHMHDENVTEIHYPLGRGLSTAVETDYFMQVLTCMESPHWE